MGVLDSCGHKSTDFDGTLKIFKGDLVVMNPQRTRNLYKLVGRAQVNSNALVYE